MRSSSIRVGSKSKYKGSLQETEKGTHRKRRNDVATSQGMPAAVSRSGRGRIHPLDSLQRDLALLTPRFWTSGLQNCERINFFVFQVCGNLLLQPWFANTTTCVEKDAVLQPGFRGTRVSSNRGPVVSGNHCCGRLSHAMNGYFPHLLKVMVPGKWQAHTSHPGQRGWPGLALRLCTSWAAGVEPWIRYPDCWPPGIPEAEVPSQGLLQLPTVPATSCHVWGLQSWEAGKSSAYGPRVKGVGWGLGENSKQTVAQRPRGEDLMDRGLLRGKAGEAGKTRQTTGTECEAERQNGQEGPLDA